MTGEERVRRTYAKLRTPKSKRNARPVGLKGHGKGCRLACEGGGTGQACSTHNKNGHNSFSLIETEDFLKSALQVNFDLDVPFLLEPRISQKKRKEQTENRAGWNFR